jgi:hypothetical protein
VEARSEWTPERWIAEIDARAQQLPSLRYSAHRTTERGEVTFEERWRFQEDRGGRFRIDYFGDTARQVTCDGITLVDYVPANRRALRFDLGAMPAADVEALLGGILARVAVPGFRVGEARGVRWAVGEGEAWQGRPAVFLEGRGEDETELRYVVDRERVALLRTEIHQEGQVVLLTDSLDHREIHPGVWFPHEVRLRSPDEGGEVRITLRLTKVRLLEDPAASIFETTLDPSIPIEEMP